MNDFRNLLLRAKDNDQAAFAEILAMYRPLLLKEAIINGTFDEDLRPKRKKKTRIYLQKTRGGCVTL